VDAMSHVERAAAGVALSIAVVVAFVCLAAGAPVCEAASGVTVSTLAGSAGVAGTEDGIGAVARLGGPYAVACDAAGNVYVADTDNGTVRKITASARVSTLVSAAAGLSYPQGVACDAAGTVFVADTYHHVVYKVLSGGGLSVLAGFSGEQGTDDGAGAAARFSYPGGLACDAAGDIYVADSGNDEVRKITPAGVVTTVAGPEAGLDSPQSVACAPDGTVYVADTGGSRVVEVGGAGLVVVADAAAGLSYPGGVACDAAGTVYIADTDGDCIRRVAGIGSAPVIAGAPDVPGSADGPGTDARFDGPEGVACDASGNVYVADTGNSTVRKLSIDSLAPVTKVSPELAATSTSGWHTAAVTLTLTASDAGSSVAATYYTLDGGDPVPCLTPFVVGAPGSHLVTYYSVDAGGNTETAHRGYVNIDTVAPVTSALPVLAADPSSGWVGAAQTVTLSATDDLSGVAVTRYSVDGAAAAAYGAPFLVTGAGSHAITYWSVDVAGNAETAHAAYVNIDGTTPVTVAAPALAGGPTTGWRNSPLTVTLSASDAGAGVASTHYSIDGALAVTYDAPFVVGGAGSHLVAWSSTNTLGAVETTRTGYVNIDLSVPVTSATPATVRSSSQVTLHFRVDDAAPSCGSAGVTIQVKRGGATVRTLALGSRPVNASLSYRLKLTLPKGVYSWRVPATDAAGNKAVKVGSAKLTVR
jgi:sugar lactone lactonase YvrE